GGGAPTEPHLPPARPGRGLPRPAEVHPGGVPPPRHRRPAAGRRDGPAVQAGRRRAPRPAPRRPHPVSPFPDPVSPMHASSPQPEIETLRQRVRTLERERTHLLTVIEILQEVAGSLQFSDVVQAVSRKLGEAFGLDRSSVFLVERGGEVVRLVATYEDPSIRNYEVDVERYPELKRAIQTGRTVFIPDVASDPALRQARGNLATRRVKSITVVPITWRGRAIGAIFLRTFRDGPSFSDEDVRFCEVVASLTAKALRNAHRFERLRAARGEDPALRAL